MTHVRDPAVVRSALLASDAGMSDAENAAQHGVAIKTIRRWRRLYQRQGQTRGQSHLLARCPLCEGGSLARDAYAELFGWYLGDGHITLGRRQVYALHIYNDRRYVELNSHLKTLLKAVKPGCRPHTREVPGCIVTTVSWKHWPCLFPQHGPGRKHERRLEMASWQRDIVEQHPADFLRGLFHSDGARVANWATRTVAGTRKRYAYPRWMFVNRSPEILTWCTEALDLVDVPWRCPRDTCVAVSTRAGVARLDALIGPKT